MSLSEKLNFDREQQALATLGLVLLSGLAVLAWLKRPAVLHIEEAPAPVLAAQWDKALVLAKEVRINSATLEELERLPKIGPALAKRILEARQRQGAFSRLEDLLSVPGIGPKMLETIAPLVTFD